VHTSITRSFLKYPVDPNADPSRLFSNTAPDPRQEVWSHKKVLKLTQRAWREGYFRLCAAIAVGWDTMLSPIDIRELRGGPLVTDDTRDAFILDRAKSRPPPPSLSGRRPSSITTSASCHSR
jgi:hypothetical protein